MNETRADLHEGNLAWEHGQPQAAVEALASAELLGKTAPDLFAARIQALCGLTLIDTAMANPAPVNVAVIDTPETADLGALIMTELSAHPAIHLVERSDLAKVGDELKLQQLAGNDAVALGKLVGADGLIFISKGPDGLHERFTAVGLGYTLFDDLLETPANNPAQEARVLAHRVEDYAPKLKLTPAQAVPISVLNLRADYATGDAAALERKLTLLLESRLAALPDYVVLERRHGWSLGFERAFSAHPKPLLPGAYVVDGTLDLPMQNPGSNSVTAHLRLRSPNQQQTPLELHGSTSDLPGLVEQMTTEIRKATGNSNSAAPWQPQKEAREYLEEGIWGWQHHADDAALEALASAELLGETAPDLIAVRIGLLCRRASDGMDVRQNYQKPLPPDSRSLDQRTDDALEAIREVVRYANEKMESKLQIFQSSRNLDVRTGDLQERVATLASELLAYLDAAGSPHADELRQALRSVTGYDPLHGRMGTNFRSWLRDTYADEWAHSLAEELAYYHLLFTQPNQYLPATLPARQGQEFCPRFLKTPEEQQKAFAQFVQGLKDDPAGKLSYLLIKSCSNDEATASAACRDYLCELWNRREQLMAGKEPRAEITNLQIAPEKIRQQTAHEIVPFLRFYLSHLDDIRDGRIALTSMCQPEGWTKAEASGIWTDYLAFKARAQTTWKKRNSNPEALATYLDEFEKPIRDKFPQLTALKTAARTPLVVTRFWQPELLPDALPERFTIPDCVATADGLCLLGTYHFSEGKPSLYEIHLPDFKSERIDIPDANNIRALRATPDTYYVEYYKRDSQQYLARFDRKTRVLLAHVMKLPFSDTQFYAVDGSLYFSMEKGGLAHYNWDKDAVTLLTSPRRKPPQNQFDDQSGLSVSGVFAGPGNQPCFTTEGGTYYIQDQPGTWRRVFDSDRFTNAITVQGKTLVCSQDGEVVLLDPAQRTPQYLMASAQAFHRDVSWAAQARWDPPERGLISNGSFSNSIGLHGDDLYDLISPVLPTGTYELLVYSKNGGRTPRHIPLNFKMDEATRSALTPIYNNTDPGHPAPEWILDKIEHPGSPFFSLKLVPTNQGLCLVSYVGGFWFLSFSDIDAYLKSNAK